MENRLVKTNLNFSLVFQLELVNKMQAETGTTPSVEASNLVIMAPVLLEMAKGKIVPARVAP
jgi:hypothetical protein